MKSRILHFIVIVLIITSGITGIMKASEENNMDNQLDEKIEKQMGRSPTNTEDINGTIRWRYKASCYNTSHSTILDDMAMGKDGAIYVTVESEHSLYNFFLNMIFLYIILNQV